jgi:type IV pilus assembly protein PilW
MNALRSGHFMMNSLPMARSRQRGLSLIELMIALALGLIIVAALAQLFVNISRTNLEMAKTNSQIENARFAMQFLQNDIVHGGYWGGFIPDFDDFTVTVAPLNEPTLKPNPICQPYTLAAWNQVYRNNLLGIPVEVYGPGALPPGCGSVVTDRLPNTDLLIVRHAGTCVVGTANCEAEESGKLYLQVSNCGADTDAYSLDPNSYGLRQLDCSASEVKRKFVQNIYYIRDWANEDSPKDEIPTLVRSEFDLSPGGALEQQDPVALVEGIERFHVELGIDRESQTGEAVDYTAAIDWVVEDFRTTPRNRGDGTPEGGFERCLSEDAGCDVDDLANVVAAKLYLLARANEETAGYTDSKTYTMGSLPVPAFNDGFKRHVFSSTVRLNNIAGRRETPFDPNEVVTP